MLTVAKIQAGIEKAEQAIAAKNFTPEKAENLRVALDMSFEEYCKFQDLKSLYMGTVLDTEAAQYVYGILGNTPDRFNAQPLAVKYVMTELFKVLVDVHINKIRRNR